MSGHFSAFKKREKNSEINKFSQRDKLVKRKSNLIDYGSFGNEGNKQFPSLSDEELNKVKKEIKENMFSKNRKNSLIFGISFFVIITILIYFSIKYNVI